VADVEGTGLGLAIVRQVMARHHGGLAVESEAGKGARFTVYARVEGPADLDRRTPPAAERPERMA
jgi:signal transduction histidine kinase